MRDKIFVAATQGVNPLPQQIEHRMFDSLSVAIIGEARGGVRTGAFLLAVIVAVLL